MVNSRPGVQTSRLFIAVKPHINENILESISDLKHTLQKSVINWVAPENLHLTLNFLGDTPSSTISRIEDAINDSIHYRY